MQAKTNTNICANSITTINPFNSQELEKYELYSEQKVNQILSNSHNSLDKWQQTDYTLRSKLLNKIADVLEERTQQYSQIISVNMGKPITQARAEIAKCAWGCRHYAEYAKDYLASQLIETDYTKSFVSYQPLGMVYGIMPWNFPFWQVFRFAAPTLMAGNTVIIKHADNCVAIGLAIESLFREVINSLDIQDKSELSNIFSILVINHEQSESVIADSRIVAVTLTGSDKAGSIVGSQAAKHIKKSVLELGGNDPYIILEDADLDLAAKQCVAARLNNSGQVCIAAKRIIVLKTIENIFKQKVIEELKNYKIGNPLDSETNLGPMARADLRDNLHEQIQNSIKLGAKRIYGVSQEEYLNNYYNQPGYYYPITVLDNVKSDMPAYYEELFGPCFSFISANNINHAIEIANDSKYGLSAAIFTKDISLAENLAEFKIKSGTVSINKMVASDPRLPFGGIKASGYGRELGREGILEFVNTKTILLS